MYLYSLHHSFSYHWLYVQTFKDDLQVTFFLFYLLHSVYLIDTVMPEVVREFLLLMIYL
jgi:hypothetical protein